MKLNLTFIKLLGILVVVFLLLNPETVPLALFVDAIGIELFMLLIGSQLFSIGSASLQNFLRITVSFLRGFSSYGTLFPKTKWCCCVTPGGLRINANPPYIEDA